MEFNFREYLILEADEYPDLTFGVEIEVSMANYNDQDISRIMNQMKLGWSFGKDMTCMPGIEMKTKPNPITNDVLHSLESDLNIFNKSIEKLGLQVIKNPGRCATHIHIGGLSEESKIKVAKIWIDGGVQDMETALIHPERKKLLDAGTGSYMRRVNSINQYQTLPHDIATSTIGKFIQRTLSYLKNMLSFDRYAGYDKFYSMSPRGGLGTLEFRTKESTTDGHELAILVKTLAAFCSAADSLYNQMQGGKKLDTSDIRKSLYQGGVSGKDLAYVMRRSAGK